MGKKGSSISHLMFADDLLMFGKATNKKIGCIIDVLNKSCAISYQRISVEKSKISFSKNTT